MIFAVRHENNRIVKYKNFATAAEAQAHVDLMLSNFDFGPDWEVVDGTSLPPTVEDWRRGPDGTWSNSPAVIPVATRAALLSVPMGDFCAELRSVYAAEGAPLGPIAAGLDMRSWVAAVIAALDDDGADAVITPAQKQEAIDRWAGAWAVDRNSPLISLLAPLLFGDQIALAAGGETAATEIARVLDVTDRLFLRLNGLAED